MEHTAQQYYRDNFEIIELKNEITSAKIAVNIGNTLFSLKQNDEKLYFPFSLHEYKSNTKLAGVPFMHPWANRLKNDCILVENGRYDFPSEHKKLLYRDGNNLAMHGLLLKSSTWKTIELHEDENYCSHTAELIFDDAAFLSIFPFIHKIRIKHMLQNKELNIETTILNLDEKDMPMSFGFHPYFFRKNRDEQLCIAAKSVIAVNDVMIPTGNVIAKESKWNFTDDKISLQNISFDDGFQDLKLNENKQTVFSIQPSQTVQAEGQAEHIEIRLDKNYPFAQIYAPSNPEKPYVCIEPMTAITNALSTNNCKKIKKDESFTASFSIVLS